jgi:hypothetical protein
MITTPLFEFFGSPVVELDGWQVFVGRAGTYASSDGRKGINLDDRRVPTSVRTAYQTHKQSENT